jgi:hypothetical protein
MLCTGIPETFAPLAPGSKSEVASGIASMPMRASAIISAVRRAVPAKNLALGDEWAQLVQALVKE